MNHATYSETETARDDPATAPFGTVFAKRMSITYFKNEKWTEVEMVASDQLTLHPGAHVLHYASTCFEGLKAYRHADGAIHTFRIGANVTRMQQSARLLYLPEPGEERLKMMILDTLKANEEEVPEAPAAMYIRPTLIGTQVCIGSAAAPSFEACLYVLLSPVGDYFTGGARPLRIVLEQEHMRTAPHAGIVKTGGNYASALPHIMRAKTEYQADQVLFCPEGIAQETGAANFLLINDNKILTKDLDETFLHGVTRDSILRLGAHMGYEIEERPITIEEVLDWCRTGEAALSGTAAVLAGVGELVHNGEIVKVGNGEIGPNTEKLRQALVDIQLGNATDHFGWVEKV
ncbi:MAG: branched-chain amino acid aminotransferase [Arenicellales bacterium]|nr:branched-chain amino acid aminotransferase [Arenicellales bacterium]